MSTIEGRIKGAALREFIIWYAETRGQSLLDQKLGRLAPGERQQLDLAEDKIGVLASNWYPAYVIHSLLDQIFESVGSREREEMIEEGAKAVMSATLHGVYRLLFKTMMSPSRYAKFSQRLWDRYYDCGTMLKETYGENRQLTTIRDWASHHPVICDLNYAGSQFIFEAMGCRNVSVSRIGCVSTGQEVCSFSIAWDA